MKILITGASSGIGKDMAYILAKNGHDLILAARRIDKLNEVKKQLKTNVECIAVDLSVRENCFKLYNKVKDKNIDMLINNAGFGQFGEFIKSDINKELAMIDTNITAVHILTKLFLQDFVKRNNGYILNTASAAGFMSGPLMATYYATKNYVVRLTEAIYEELRRKKSNVHISAFCPGPVETEFDKVANVSFSLKGLNSYDAASYAIEKTLKGKLLIVPSIKMKLGKFGLRFLSEKTIARIAFNIQKNKT